MASKMIFDYPALLEEVPLLDLTQATKSFPIRRSRATLERWIRRGVRGIQLETVLIGNRRFTTEPALRRFLLAQQHTEPEHARTESKQSNLSSKEIAEASRRFGLPEPQGSTNVGTTKQEKKYE